VPDAHLSRAVDRQKGAQGSVMEHYRTFIAFRKQHAALIKGAIRFLPVTGNVVGFTRAHGEETLLCLFNMGEAMERQPLPPGDWSVLSGHGLTGNLEGATVELPAWGGLIARLV
jgi:alpha-glucosidase